MSAIIHDACIDGGRVSRRGRPCAVEPELSGPAPRRYRRASATAAPRHLLVLRFAVFNLAAFALLGAAAVQGWINTIVESDVTGLSVGIFAVFFGGLAVCARKVWWVGREQNCAFAYDPCRRSWASDYLAEIAGRGSGSRSITASALQVKIYDRIAVVRHVASSLVLLGLIGTVLGFIVALSGVDPAVAGDPRSIAPMVTTLIRGMSVALYTTLVGAVLNLWLNVNYRILAGGAAKLLTGLVTLGEANARPGQS